jgi:hypothetical protein
MTKYYVERCGVTGVIECVGPFEQGSAEGRQAFREQEAIAKSYNSDEQRLGWQSIYVVDECRLPVNDEERIKLLLGSEPQY